MVSLAREPVLAEFYFMRHPQSEANARRKANGGDSDSRITMQGKEDTFQTRRFFTRTQTNLSAIYHSRMTRCFEAADLINGDFSLDLIESADFDEQFLGEWEGADWDLAAELFLSGEDPPNGETYRDFHARIINGLKALSERVPETGEMPLIISHGGVWMALHKICGSEPSGWPDNCDVYKMRITGDWDSPKLESELLFRLPPMPPPEITLNN